MTVDAVTAGQSGLQRSRYAGMAQSTVVIVNVDDGVQRGTLVVTGHTNGRPRDMAETFVVSTAVGQRVGRVTDQTGGRVGTGSDCVDNLGPRAAVTEGTTV